MSNEIFSLEEEERRILKYLALHGPLNLSELSQYTTKYAHSLDRWSLKKHLYGSSRFIGLIPYEYVSLTKKNKKETKYELTTKGVLAALPFVRLEENVRYQKFVIELKEELDHKEIEVFIKKFVTEFINLILQWHHISGVNLKKLKSSEQYFMNFIDDVRKVQSVNINTSQIFLQSEFFYTIRNCIEYATIIDLITSGDMFKGYSLFTLVDWDKTKIPDSKKIIDEKYSFAFTLWRWPFELGKFPYSVFKTYGKSMLYDYYSDKMKSNIDLKMKKLDINLKWKSKTDSPIKLDDILDVF